MEAMDLRRIPLNWAEFIDSDCRDYYWGEEDDSSGNGLSRGFNDRNPCLIIEFGASKLSWLANAKGPSHLHLHTRSVRIQMSAAKITQFYLLRPLHPLTRLRPCTLPGNFMQLFVHPTSLPLWISSDGKADRFAFHQPAPFDRSDTNFLTRVPELGCNHAGWRPMSCATFIKGFNPRYSFVTFSNTRI